MDWLTPTIAAGAALLGAIVGGLFTLWSQAREASAQRSRDAETSRHQREVRQIERSEGDVRTALQLFLDCRQALREEELIQREVLGPDLVGWDSAQFLSPHVRRLNAAVLLVPDPNVRAQTTWIVEHLLSATHFVDDAQGFEEDSVCRLRLTDVLRKLLGHGVELLAAEIRGDSFVAPRDDLLHRFEVWENDLFERADQPLFWDGRARDSQHGSLPQRGF